MSVREIFNLRSRPSMFIVGALGLTAAFLDFSQATVASGVGRALLLGLGTSCLIFGGALVVASLSGLRESWRKVAQRKEFIVSSSAPRAWGMSVTNPDLCVSLRESRNSRLVDAAGAVALGSSIALIEPDMAPLISGLTLTFAVVKAGLAVVDHHQLRRELAKPQEPT